MSKLEVIYRRLLYIALATLTPIGAAVQSGQPLDGKVWVAVAISVAVTLRAFEDKSTAQVETAP